MVEDALGRAGARVHADEQGRVAARLEERGVARPLVLDDVLAGRVEISAISELKLQAGRAPWQSMTTISVAPAALAPRTAALISSV